MLKKQTPWPNTQHAMHYHFFINYIHAPKREKNCYRSAIYSPIEHTEYTKGRGSPPGTG